MLLFIRHGRSEDFEFMFQQEVGVMTTILEEARFKVVISTDSGEPVEYYSFSSREYKLFKPDKKLADIEVGDYVGVIMPCMAKGSDGHADPEEISLVKDAVAHGKPIAAQRGAIIILGEAGALEGKKYAFKNPYPRFKGALYSGTGVIRDGKIITSAICPNAARYYGDPDGTPELVELFVEAIKE